MTTDLIERIQTVRMGGCPCHDSDEVRARLESAAAAALPEERHVVEIDWGR
ncbi:MAG: hypothetical protein ACLQRH_21135 [Acidimicrobiales bacterium]